MQLRWTLIDKLVPFGDTDEYRTFQIERMSCMEEEKQSVKEEQGKFRKERFAADIEDIKLQGLEIKALEDNQMLERSMWGQ